MSQHAPDPAHDVARTAHPEHPAGGRGDPGAVPPAAVGEPSGGPPYFDSPVAPGTTDPGVVAAGAPAPHAVADAAPGAEESRPLEGAAPPGAPAAPRPQASAGIDADGDHSGPLVEGAEGLRSRWEAIQAGFVDEPRRAVEQADALVREVIDQLSRSFSSERQGLEEQWSRGADASTEDLRVALRRYRSFFDRLLST